MAAAAASGGSAICAELGEMINTVGCMLSRRRRRAFWLCFAPLCCYFNPEAMQRHTITHAALAGQWSRELDAAKEHLREEAAGILEQDKVIRNTADTIAAAEALLLAGEAREREVAASIDKRRREHASVKVRQTCWQRLRRPRVSLVKNAATAGDAGDCDRPESAGRGPPGNASTPIEHYPLIPAAGLCLSRGH
jgi:hypothetical protein